MPSAQGCKHKSEFPGSYGKCMEATLPAQLCSKLLYHFAFLLVTKERFTCSPSSPALDIDSYFIVSILRSVKILLYSLFF